MAHDHPPAGIEPGAVTAWLGERVAIDPPLRFELIAGGRSNLTFTVTDQAGRRFVLRRPPLHSVLDSAHDVGREYRIMTALRPTAVPVPETVGYCADTELIGAPFYVMHHVDGLVVRDVATAERLPMEARHRAAEQVVDVLLALHALDPEAVGLGDLGRHDGYIERQLRRWRRQLAESRTRELPLLEEVADRLARAIPPQQGVAIVHGDYRLDNLIVGPDGEVRAVLDWELCTLGDALADLGLLVVYWAEPGDDLLPLLTAPTLAAGFPGRRWIAERYAAGSPRRTEALDFYIAFAYWKLAIILEGVYARFRAGAYGDLDDPGVAGFAAVVDALAERAADAAARAGI